MRNFIPAFFFLIFVSLSTQALNITIIEDANVLHTMDKRWDTICTTMGHTATLFPVTFLDNFSNLSSTDILIYASGVDNVLNPIRIASIRQFLQNGGKVYLQTEYDSSSFDTDAAFANLLRSFGSSFAWTGTVQGVLAPMNILGSIATDYTTTTPLGYFWWGCTANVFPDVENFLEFQGNYYGFIYCTPNGGRIITTSDQDWINSHQTPSVDSLMMNIISNLAKTSYNCSNTIPSLPIADFVMSDSVFCDRKCIDFTDISINNPTSWHWLFPGGDPDTSSLQNPTNVCYNDSGIFDVTLIACNSSGCDTLHLYNVIHEFPALHFAPIVQTGDTLFSVPGYSAYQWYFDTLLIAGASNYFYYATHDGNYAVAVTDSNGCFAEATALNVITLTTDLSSTSNNFYSNYHSGTISLNINSINESPVKIELIDYLGNIVLAQNGSLHAGKNEIEFQVNISIGIYFIKLEKQNLVMINRLIVN